MSQVTLEQIQEHHEETTRLIEKFKLQSQSTKLEIPAAQITLLPGERYVGPLLNVDGSIECHLVLVAVVPEGLDHDAATAWAKSKGGELASRVREIRLVQANAPDLLPSSGWCWLKELHGSSYAWGCVFSYGYINYTYRSSEGGAVAVRRVSA